VVVLITGCSSGIGAATADHLVQRATPSTPPPRPETLAPLVANGARALALDVNDEASMSAAVAQVEQEHGAARADQQAGYSSPARLSRFRSTTSAGSSRRTSSA